VQALNGDLRHYKCCQGYFDCAPCFTAGQCGEESSPEFCLCLESCCCLHFAIQSTRFFVMDSRSIRPDPCDNRILHFHNSLQCLTCLCETAALCSNYDELRDLASILRCISDAVYYTVLGCMVAQVALELANHPGEGDLSAPIPQAMTRDASSQPPHGQPMAQQGQPMGYSQSYGQQPVAYAQQPVAYGQQPVAYAQQPVAYPQQYGQAVPVAMAQPVGVPIAQAHPVG